ncbi:RagB/SusD domain-containing protein [uncultured Paludibacter sp.]|uniref:RagB/SusD domain-containing protein n=1 Tax=uncultured Paludibacter sp. TaxID=497635 RepID=A0A653AGM6_9BACT|nr:RagB/SusD domain-containing protein [uncultured Paludibacter sp.]
MKNKILFATIALFSIILAGCNDLDTYPEGSTLTSAQKEEIYKLDPKKAEAGVNAIFAQFSQYEPNYKALGNVGRHNDFGYPSVMIFTDANGYDLVTDDNGYNWTGSDLDFSDRDYTSRESQIVWNDMYSMIYTTNNVIGSISLETTEAKNKYYLAQGLAVRAYSYFILAQLYQFNYVGNESKLCVPIITNENSNEAALNGAPRKTVQEVYELILSDINNAITLLTSAEQSGIHRNDKRYISLAVAYGLRARINLTMQKWSDALADANNAISHSEATPASFNDVKVPSFWDISEKNWMWGIIIAETDDVVSSGIVNWISHMGSLNYGYANYSGGRQINKILYNSINSTDARKGWWLNENKVSANLNTAQQQFMTAKSYKAYTQCKFAPYNNEVGTATNANDIPLMRIEEMYLIKAEAEAMSGGDGSTTLTNFIKQYRDPNYTSTASTPADVQEEVFRQRRIELWGEGLNWYDIMRLNKSIDRRGCGFPNATMIFNIPAGAPILLWRIPEAEIQANPALPESDNNPAAPLPTPVSE